MTRWSFSPWPALALVCALVLPVGCSSLRNRMGGAAGAPPALTPRPKLSASASLMQISTNVQPTVAASQPVKPETLAVAMPAAPGNAYKLRPGDPIVIFLRGIEPKDDELHDIVDDGGYLNMPYIGAVLAAGKTTSQLENEIQKMYLDQQIYKSITVNVVLPSQNFFVSGEVKIPGRFPMVSGMTVMQAISAAGGYTEFADPRGATVIRGKKVIKVNARDLATHPELDIPLEPGDVIVVPRSLF